MCLGSRFKKIPAATFRRVPTGPAGCRSTRQETWKQGSPVPRREPNAACAFVPSLHLTALSLARSPHHLRLLDASQAVITRSSRVGLRKLCRKETT